MMNIGKLLFLTAIGLSACAAPVPRQPEPTDKNSLTTGQVQITLKKDVTTQVEVLETFGSPNLVTVSSDGLEVWTYQRHATVASASSSGAYGTIILFGASSRRRALSSLRAR
jgi:hypothetical protein